MKELSIEEKARAYDRVSKEVKDFFEGRQKMYSDVNQTLEYLFPELKESEDEKVRQKILFLFYSWRNNEQVNIPNKKEVEKAISWLEKQAERKTPHWMIDFLDNYRRKIGCCLDHDEARDVEGKILCIMQWLENQDEQEKDILEDAIILDGNENGLIAETIRYKKEKQGEKKPYGQRQECIDCQFNYAGECKGSCGMKRGEQKPKRMVSAEVKEAMYDTNWSEEDEKVRKALLEMVHDTTGDELWIDYDVHKEEALGWLERQGEHANFLSKIQVGDKVTRNEAGMLVNLSQLKRVAKTSERQGENKASYTTIVETGDGGINALVTRELPIDGEQKPADKVEPKFKVGDWIVQKGLGIYKIVEVCESWYEVISYNDGIQYSIGFDKENDCHLWTIQDAKEGDVLYHKAENGTEYIVMSKGLNENNNIDSYFRYNSINGFGIDIPSVLSAKCDSITPATKEQRDTLLKAMADAGYTFDFEKKELKKITQKPEENKGNIGGISSNWSEEEKAVINKAESWLDTLCDYLKDSSSECIPDVKDVISKLKSLKGRVGCEANCTTTKEWSEEDERLCRCLIEDQEEALNEVRNDKYGHSEIISDLKEMYNERINWLKSLRPQNKWKPSKEQIKVCKEVYADILSAKGFDLGTVNDELNRMEEELKKLKDGKV